MTILERKLSAQEQGMWLGAQSTPINFTLMARIQGTFTLEELRTALAKARQKHPLLGVRIIRDAGSNLIFTSREVPDFSIRVVEHPQPDDWQREAEAELTQNFDLAVGPLIRLVWLRAEATQELIFVCYHGVADGLAVAYLIHDVMTYLGEPETPVLPMPLVPGLRELIPDFPGKSAAQRKARLKSLLFKLSLSVKKFRKKRVSEPAKRPSKPAKPILQLRAWELSAQQTTALVTRCRAEKTSVHAALCSAFLRAFGELRQDGWLRNIQSPINLRSQLNPPVGQAFGCFIGLVIFPVECNPDLDFWAVARAVKAGFQQHTSAERVFPQIVQTGVIMDQLFGHLTPESAGDAWIKVNYDLSITNLGRLDFQREYGSLQLEAIYGPSVSGIPEEVVLGVTTLRDQLRFTLIFTNLSLDNSQAQKIQTHAMKQLAEAVAWS